ncbi:hypothetical protein [Streptomyces sp. NPDC094032]|uniref:hypothetical protein n=1 Tax=Streptomyces sp. NPDC094032 TaxID=3155308 RepID=UPI003318FB65
MNGAFFTGVRSEGGPVHTGPGPQYVDYHFHYEHPPGAPPIRPLAVDHLLWLYHRFVEPGGMATARERLKDMGTLLLDAAPGSGRNAAARMLLYKAPGSRAPRQLLAENDAGGLDLRPDQFGEGDRLLLDLADADGPAWSQVRTKLSALHQVVRERRSLLVVIVPHGSQGLSNELEAHRHPIVRPDGMSVLRRNLRREGFPFGDDPDGPDGLAEPIHAYVAGDPPVRDIAALARLLAEARRARPDTPPEHWCDVALTSLRKLGGHVAEHVEKLTQGGQRALLLTTAMLPGASPNALHAASEALLRIVGHPADERPVLEREDLSRRLKEIEAELRPDGSVAFDRPDYAAAVRQHFWAHRPGMWAQFGKWVERAVLLPALASGDRDVLIAGFAEQSLRTGQYRSLLTAARRWADREDPRLIQAAVQALGHGLSDTRAGRHFRVQVYGWSLEQRISSGLLSALVSVSAEVIAPSFPDQALVRLHHLARQAAGPRQQADARLYELALSEERLHRKMLHRLDAGLSQHTWQADATLFRSCAAPPLLTTAREDRPPLLARDDVRDTLVSAWGSLFTRRPEADWSPQAEDWLSAAGADGRYADVLLDVLARAARPSPSVVARLYVLSLRHSCSLRLRRRLDAVQGLRPTGRPRF